MAVTYYFNYVLLSFVLLASSTIIDKRRIETAIEECQHSSHDEERLVMKLYLFFYASSTCWKYKCICAYLVVIHPDNLCVNNSNHKL